MEKLKEALVNLGRVCGEMCAAFNEMCAAFNEMCNWIKDSLKVSIAIMKYPNGRVKHLALNGKKARTRKKNLKRILKG